MKITFIGGGNMASALIGGLLARDYARDQLEVVDVSPNARAKLERAYSLKTYPGPTVATLGDCIVLAVKPQHVRDAVLQLTQSLSAGALVVSIAAGIRTGDLSRWLGGHPGIVRVMPNTPALVRAAISALFAMPAVTQEQRARAENILSAVGETLWLEDESQMDAITGISGSGPAYVFYFLESLTEAARQLGFDAKEARRLALATFNGSLKLASESNDEFATLRANVTSKGGTTERAIKTMDAADVKSSIARAVRAAAERSQEIGRELGEN